MRKQIIIGNWKMHKTMADVQEFVQTFNTKFTHDANQIIGIGAPFIYLDYLQKNLSDGIIAAEDCSQYIEAGAYTGDVSSTMLASIGVNYSIVGHSERRRIFGDTNVIVNQKIKAALALGVTPIFCIGEPPEVFNSNSTHQYLDKQLSKGLAGIKATDVMKIVIAYEPIWAIGSGKTASPAIAQKSVKYIRGVIESMYGASIAEVILIQYGGSVKLNNTHALLQEKDIDGLLIGGAALSAEGFLQIIEESRK